jgi:glycerol-3-phosphate acyltransferase PlsY
LVMMFAFMRHNPATPYMTVPFIIFSWIVGIMLVWTHRKNIQRLREGTESKIYIWQPPK